MGQDIDVPNLDIAVIKNISVKGNIKTKKRAILREMDVSVGDTIRTSEIANILGRNQQYIFNTSLFQKVELNIRNWDSEKQILDIEVLVTEDWYIYPIPIFSLADRNFNVWWKDFDASFDRVNYGMRFYHFNTTGIGDRSKLLLQLGYQKRFEISYDRPYINKAQTLGWENTIRYQSRKEVNYSTLANKQVFVKDDNRNLFESFQFKSTLTYRPRINRYHSITLEYFNNTITDTIAGNLNPAYFLSGSTKQRYFSLRYAFINDLRNLRTYPTKGSYYQGRLTKEGLGLIGDINLFEFEQTYAKYFTITPKLTVETSAKVTISLNRKQPPFYNYKAIGYFLNDIRGYELYVIDALDFGFIKTSIRQEIFNSVLRVGKIMPIKTFRSMPIRVMLTLNNDFGYTNDPFYAINNELSNRWLWGGGLGLDLLLYNDYVFQVEYSFNELSENGLFLKVKLPF